MKMTELKDLDQAALQEKLEAAVAALDTMKLNHKVTPLENPQQIRAARRDIARMQTEVRQRQINNK